VFSAGVLLYELLTCERFASTRDPAVLRRLVQSRSEGGASQRRPSIPAEVDALLRQALAPDPEQRFGTAQEFHDAVQRALVSANPLYAAPSLRSSVLEPLFNPDAKRRRLRTLARSLDLEEIVACSPETRTVCLGEAFPLRGGLSDSGDIAAEERSPKPLEAPPVRFGGDEPVLTFMGELFEGDTEPMALEPPAASHRKRAAVQREAGAQPSEPAREAASRSGQRWRLPVRRKLRRASRTASPHPRRVSSSRRSVASGWLEVKTS
jgi:serine/threonine protein kinase